MKKYFPQISAAKKFIAENKLMSAADRVLLSMSAGKDSVFLFHLFLHLREEDATEFAVFHLNHKTRGSDSGLDEEFVKSISEKNSVRVFPFQYDFSCDNQTSQSFEERAREKRYSLLRQTAEENGFTKIATGHSADDNVETILMRIFSGTGLHGLQGIKAARGIIIRPMLGLTSAEIIDYLKVNEIEWREDRSNSESIYARNFIRNEIIPLAEKKFINLSGALNNLRGIAEDSLKIIDEFIALKYRVQPETGSDFFSFDAECMKHDRASLYHTTAKGFRHIGLYPAMNILDEIYRNFSVPKPNGRLYSSNGCEVLKKRSMMIVQKPAAVMTQDWEYEIDLSQGDGSIFVPECGMGIHFKLEDYHPPKKYKEQDGILFIDPNDNSRFKLRNRRHGDRINLGFGSKKIKELMIDLKTDPDARNIIPILETDFKIAAYLQGIVLNNGSRVSHEFMVNSSSKKVLAIWGVKKSYPKYHSE